MIAAYTRSDRIAAELQRALSQIIPGIKDPRVSKIASITRIDVTRDLAHAKVHISVLGGAKAQEETVAGLQNAAGFMRRELGTKVDMRSIPALHFVLDNSIEYGIHMSKIFDELNTARSDKDD